MKTAKPEIPEYLLNLMESGEEIDQILLDKEGNWFHNGAPFRNKRIIEFFNRSISVTSDGRFVLHYGNYTYPVIVEDAPLFITGVVFKGFGEFEKIFINLSSGHTEELDIDTLFYRKNNALYCRVAGGDFTAKFMRSPSFHIMERLDEVDCRYYLNLCGKKILLKQEE